MTNVSKTMSGKMDFLLENVCEGSEYDESEDSESDENDIPLRKKQNLLILVTDRWRATKIH